jgi:uncharacterized membrane protein YfcA
MLSTPESQHRAYIVAVLLCSIFPASLVFWCVGFVLIIVFAYLFLAGHDDARHVTSQSLQIVALLASLSVVYRFWKLATKQPPEWKLDEFQALLLKPKTVTGLFRLLVAGTLSTLLGVASFVIGWITFNQF